MNNKKPHSCAVFLRFLPFARKRYPRTAILAKCKILLDFSKPRQRAREHFGYSGTFF